MKRLTPLSYAMVSSVVAVAGPFACATAANAQSGGLPASPTPSLQTADAFSAEALPSNSPILTLAEAIRLAINANPQYRSAKLQALAGLEQYKSQRAQYYPTLYTAALFSELLDKVKITVPAGQFGSFPSTGKIPATDTTLTTPRKPFSLFAGYASQPITGLIGTHYSVDAQRWMAESKDFQAEQMRQQQLTMVKKAYTLVNDAEAQAASSTADVAAARESARIAHLRRDQATVLQSQVETADAQLASAENRQQQDRDQLAQNKEKLNQLIGRDVMTEFATEPVEETEGIDDLSDDALREMALQNRLELKSDDASIRAGELQVKATQAKYIPDISASVVYIGLPNSVRGLPDSFTTAGAQLTWSPWDWGQKTHEIRAQRASVAQSHIQRDRDRNQIIADVNQAARLVRQRRLQMRSADLNAKAKRSRLLETQEQVRNKTALMDDMLQAQSDYMTAQTQSASARNGLLEAKAQLQQAIGEVQ